MVNKLSTDTTKQIYTSAPNNDGALVKPLNEPWRYHGSYSQRAASVIADIDFIQLGIDVSSWQREELQRELDDIPIEFAADNRCILRVIEARRAKLVKKLNKNTKDTEKLREKRKSLIRKLERDFN